MWEGGGGRGVGLGQGVELGASKKQLQFPLEFYNSRIYTREEEKAVQMDSLSDEFSAQV